MKTSILFITSPLIPIKMRYFVQNLMRKSKHICSLTFVFENRAFFKITWKNFVEPDRPQMRTWRMRVGCWIPKVTSRLPEYVIVLLIASPLQQWLHERASLLRYA